MDVNDQPDSDKRLPKKTLAKHQRVVRAAEFTEAIRRGIVAADGTLVVFLVAKSPADKPRLGVTIPKRTGNAVVRNRWKRWIRESFRQRQFELPLGYDVVVRPKKDAIGSWAAVDRSLYRLIQRATKKV
jgi:ribonuclease P protein component